MFYLEHEMQPKLFSDIPSTLWWAMVSLTTVGYGDIYPITAIGKILATIVSFLGIAIVALPSGIIAAGFVEESAKMKDKGD